MSTSPLLTTDQLAKLVPGRGTETVSPYTIGRWIRFGVVRHGDGQRIFLKGVRLGGRLFATLSDFQAFQAALNPAPSAATPPRTPTARARANAAARKELAAMGVCGDR